MNAIASMRLGALSSSLRRLGGETPPQAPQDATPPRLLGNRSDRTDGAVCRGVGLKTEVMLPPDPANASYRHNNIFFYGGAPPTTCRPTASAFSSAA
jgi:hypothetical protein